MRKSRFLRRQVTGVHAVLDQILTSRALQWAHPAALEHSTVRAVNLVLVVMTTGITCKRLRASRDAAAIRSRLSNESLC